MAYAAGSCRRATNSRCYIAICKVTGVADFRDEGIADNYVYWSSSQVTTNMAHHIDFADAGRPHYDDKDFPRRVRGIRAF